MASRVSHVTLALLLASAAPFHAAQEAAVTPPAALIERLAGHPAFAKLPLRAAPGFPPIDLVLQEPYGSKPGWEAAPSNRFGPWARELVRQFEERFAQPFALRRDPSRPAPSVVVLASEGDLLNYRKTPQGRRSYSFREATWDDTAHAVVVAANSSAIALHLARFPGLHVLALGELYAHVEAPGGDALPLWVHWGLPSYLAWHTGFGPDSLKTREIDRSMLTDWYDAEGRVREGGGVLLRLDELVVAQEAGAAGELLASHAKAAGVELEPPHARYLAWCASVLWTHFLDSAEDGRLRDGYGAYLAGGLRGNWSLGAFHTAMQLDEVGVRALERGFQDWVEARLVALDLVAAPIEATPVVDPVEPEVEVEEAAIEPAPEEIALQHGLALVLARDGDLDGAVRILEASLTLDPEGAYARRIERDLERARGFRELRAAFLAGLAESGERLPLERDGKRVNVRVAAVEADRITLREARGGLEAIPFAQLDSFQVARQMGRDAGWLRVWPYALVDDERWQRLLDDDETGRALRDDAAEWYPGALRLGEVARELVAVGEDALPEDADAAQALAARIAALVRDHGDVAEVDARRAALRARAAELLEGAWTPERLGAGLVGTLERLGDDRARLTYTFDDEAELPELAPGAGYPEHRVEGREELTRTPTQSIARGDLRAAGSLSWRLPVAFAAPLEARMTLKVGEVPPGGSIYSYWALGACDDGAGNLVLVEDLGSLVVVDLPMRVSTWDSVQGGQQLGSASYTLGLTHDGEVARSFLNGTAIKELAAPTRTAGDVVVTLHSDTTISFQEIVVEGVLDEDRNRARWIERELAALGL